MSIFFSLCPGFWLPILSDLGFPQLWIGTQQYHCQLWQRGWSMDLRARWTCRVRRFLNPRNPSKHSNTAWRPTQIAMFKRHLQDMPITLFHWVLMGCVWTPRKVCQVFRVVWSEIRLKYFMMVRYRTRRFGDHQISVYIIALSHPRGGVGTWPACHSWTVHWDRLVNPAWLSNYECWAYHSGNVQEWASIIYRSQCIP